MRILAYNTGHDGAAALLEEGRLTYALETEKDDGPRHGVLTPTLFARSLQCSGPPDVLAISGWQKRWGSEEMEQNREIAPLLVVEGGYFAAGPEGKSADEGLFAGRSIRRFASSHVRSHILCSYGLSPFPQGQPCYALIWEGTVGAMYYIDDGLQITRLGKVLQAPGLKYALSYVLADPSIADSDRNWAVRMDDAGKVMALASYGHRGTPTREQCRTIDRLLALDVMDTFHRGETPKTLLRDCGVYNVGLQSQEYRDFAWQLSEAIFDRFYRFAKEHATRKLPLIIAGGCGLNCDWNSRWRDCGLFSGVFVPPCTNDSGVALGAAIDAQHHYSGTAKIQWSVYAGDEFIEDLATPADFVSHELDIAEVCRRLARGEVIAWVQGKYEMGPRALGNRSMLAAPFLEATRDRLNEIKQREPFRPIAPVCLEEDFGEYFDGTAPSPHMLYLQRVRSARLAAVTHVDGSARAQSVNDTENPMMCALLREFRRQTGVSVLCNTSLNFKARGFVNRSSQLFALARQRGIDGLVVGKRFREPRRTPA
jgi:predicted NodU family carbamoyl transferase